MRERIVIPEKNCYLSCNDCHIDDPESGSLKEEPIKKKLREELAQEFYGIFMNDPSNNHLENKEWVLLVEARDRANKIIDIFPDVGGREQERTQELHDACQAAYQWYYQGKQGDYDVIGNMLKEALKEGKHV